MKVWPIDPLVPRNLRLEVPEKLPQGWGRARGAAVVTVAQMEAKVFGRGSTMPACLARPPVPDGAVPRLRGLVPINGATHLDAGKSWIEPIVPSVWGNTLAHTLSGAW